MKTLFAAFGGVTNSSKALLDCIDCASGDKLYLKNSFRSAPAALREKLAPDTYDLVVLIGQRKITYDKAIRLETVARNNRVAYHTEVNFPELAKRLTAAGLDPIISRDAGRYLCNNLYFETLKYIDEHPLKARAIFIHVPKFGQKPDLPKIASALAAGLDPKILQSPDPL